MALLLAVRLVVRHPRDVDKLVAHVDKGVALALAAQGEIEDARVPFQRLVDIADLDRDMVDADEPRLLSFRHGVLHSECCRSLALTAKDAEGSQRARRVLRREAPKIYNETVRR